MKARAASIGAALAAGLALAPSAGAQAPAVPVIVQMRPSPVERVPVAPHQVAALLRRRAQHDQAALLRALRAAVSRGEASDVQPLWIADAIAVRARPSLIARLRRRPDVRAIEPDRSLRIRPAALAAAAAVPAASVTATGAPTLWAQGQTGRGAIVAVLDTGIVPGFPQLATTPGAWFDPYEQHTTPYDEDTRGHGTEVADVIVSMAPDVRVVAARVFSDGGRSTTSAVHRVFEWALDPDANPRTDDAPSVVNGSWDEGDPGHCNTEFDGDLAVLRAAGIVPVFAAGNAGERGPGTGASPASAPGAVAVGSVTSADVVSTFSGRGPSSCSNAIFPTIVAYGEGIAIEGPGGATVVSGTSFAAPQVSGAIALLTAMFPGATPDAIVDALVRGARDVGTPGADGDTGAGVLNVAQSAALLAGADHAGPDVTVSARWSRDAASPGLVLSGRARERGGGTSTGLAASAFVSLHGVPTAASFALSATPVDASEAALTGALGAREVRRLVDGRHHLFVRARDAAGNWGPVRAVQIPIDRAAPGVRAKGSRRGNRVTTTLFLRDNGSGLALLRYRLEVAGRLGPWHWLKPAARVKLALTLSRSRKAILRVRAVDLVGNESRAGFLIPR